MTLRTTFILLFAGLALLLAGVVYFSSELRDAQAEMAAAGIRRIGSYKLADELRQSSDDLTRMARSYTVTGDERYERYFHEILAIRKGRKARPQAYDGIYWDFVVAGGQVKGGTGERRSLRGRMADMGFTKSELAKLKESEDRSNVLARFEQRAMQAMKGRFEDDEGGFTREGKADPELARALTHGPEYHQAKAAIMKPIQEFFDALESRTAREVAAVTERSDSLATYIWLLALAAAGVVIVTGFVVQRRVLSPVRAVVSELQDMAEGEGDLTQRVVEGGADEVGALSRWFNLFVDRVHDAVKQMKLATQVVERASVQIAGSTQEQRASSSELSRVTAAVARSSGEIMETAGSLASTMGGVAVSAKTTAELAATGRTGLQSLDQTMSRFLVATEVARTKLATIKNRTHAIDQVVTTMSTVADQTNLLSMNAAIEAEKAGKHGYGFLVVAEEIRRMADQTAAATLTIEESVVSMHNAVEEGVREMTGLAQEIIAGTRATARVNHQLGGILDEVQGLRERFAEVNTGMDTQLLGARTIGESMDTLRATADDTVVALADLSTSSQSLREAVDGLTAHVDRFRV